MAPGVTGRRRLPQFVRNGYVQAYALIFGATVACAAVVHASLPDTPPSAPAADTQPLTPPRPRVTGSLKLPPADRDDMSEMVDGLRLPKISASGWMPWIAHARRFDPAGPAARVGLL